MAAEIMNRMETTVMCCIGRSADEIESKKRSQKLDKIIKIDAKKYRRQVKLLLLGAGESGKSTFLKQMKIIHGNGIDTTKYRDTIYRNIVSGIRVLVDAVLKLGIGLKNPENIEFARVMVSVNNMKLVSCDVFLSARGMIKSLWEDEGIQQAFTRRYEFQMLDSIKYFFDNFERISALHYTPTLQDVLYSRRVTTAITETEIIISGVPFLFVDVGGQRSQRSNWYQSFSHVTSIVFVASISEFDQVLKEETSTNRLRESLHLFAHIIRNIAFANISVILFLNKLDLLREKIEIFGRDISQFFPEFLSETENVRKVLPDFTGNVGILEDVKIFSLYLFLELHRGHARPLFHHYTTAVDTRNIEYVFNSVKETILRKNLDSLLLQ